MIEEEKKENAQLKKGRKNARGKEKGDCNKSPSIIILKIFYLQPNLYHLHCLIF